jgi:rhodanese-related sulfurtransferase
MPIARVDPSTLQAMLHDGEELALLDVREAGQFGEAHLLFATPLPYSRLEAEVMALIPRKAVRIVLCDAGDCVIAERAGRRLFDCGYTDVAVLQGGTEGWAQAGYPLFAGVNVPSKLFGELVEHEYHTPRISARDLVEMKARGERFLLLDGRPLNEHHKMTIPGSTCCPNAELPYRIGSMVRDPHTTIVINCAGRTRSILGAQMLINFGVPNPVYALENGTQGWRLADLELEYGSARKYPDAVDETALPAQQAAARALMARFAIKMARAPEVENWLRDARRTTYLCDVRTPEEFAAGSLPGALHAPGGQLIQATDQWIGVRNSRIVLADGGEHVRAPVVASWLKQLGYDAWVLQGGVRARLVVPPAHRPALPEVATIAPEALNDRLGAEPCALLDLGSSMQFRKRHIPGSRWSIRARIVADIGPADRTVVLVADEAVARLAAIDLREAGIRELLRLAGGVEAWAAQGYRTEATPNAPPDRECIDYLFFVHDRHAGNREAMKQYLAWETGLIGRLSAEDRGLFRVGPVAGST